MSVATQTFGLSHHAGNGGSVAAIGARVWMRVITTVQARMAAAKEARAERELLELAATYEKSMPSFAAELRAANARRVPTGYAAME